MRILNQAFCPHPERSVSEYKDAEMALPKVFFLLLPFSPLLIMAALYLLPNKLGRPPLPQLLAEGEERVWWVGVGEQGPRGRRAGLWAAEPRFAQACPPSREPVGSGRVVNNVGWG